MQTPCGPMGEPRGSKGYIFSRKSPAAHNTGAHGPPMVGCRQGRITPLQAITSHSKEACKSINELQIKKYRKIADDDEHDFKTEKSK